MGLTIESTNLSTDIPVSGFHKMRRDIAAMFDQSLADLYWAGFTHSADSDSEEFTTEMQKTADCFETVHGYRLTKQLFDFILASDIEGRASYGFCQRICEHLNTHPGNPFFTTVYGYAGWENPVTGKDLFQIFRDCAENKKPLKWR